MDVNRRWVLAHRPDGVPSESDFRLIEEPAPQPGAGDVLVRALYLSVDPYIRGRMRNVRSYVPPLEIGEVIDGAVVGKVVESRAEGLKPGDLVTGRLGWQAFASAPGKDLRKLPPGSHLPLHLGVLGMPGLTAYFGLLDVAQMKPGETVLVSGAAGAVGSVVGQIAKIRGGRSVGIAGSDEKVAFLKDIGFDAAVNYKTAGNLRKALRDALGGGVDVYFDNVGGEVSDAAVTLMNLRARVAVCGQIAIYNREKMELGPRNWLHFLVNRARLEGFLVMDFAERYPQALAEMSAWVREGRLRHRETIVNGIENAPKAFVGLFRGDNIGKQVVKVAEA